MADIARSVTGCVLAGGRGERLDGRDKGLIDLGGKPLAAHVLAALRPQVSEMLISANRNREAYAALGARVVPDENENFDGPLAGFAAAMAAAQTPLLATAPCDSPFLPNDLVTRLVRALDDAGAGIAVVTAGGRLQPVFALMDTKLLESLRAALADGERKIARWYDTHDTVRVDFSDCADAFTNINTAAELAAAEMRLASA